MLGHMGRPFCYKIDIHAKSIDPLMSGCLERRCFDVMVSPNSDWEPEAVSTRNTKIQTWCR